MCRKPRGGLLVRRVLLNPALAPGFAQNPFLFN
jgi:hypothetical protein